MALPKPYSVDYNESYNLPTLFANADEMFHILFQNINSDGGAGNVVFSAGTASDSLSSIVFSNSNGVSFGLSGSTLTASVAANSINVSAGTTSNNLTAITFANSNRVSFGLNASTITAKHALNFSVVGASADISDQIVFSNSNGVTFGLVGSTITASISNTATTAGSQFMSYYENIPAVGLATQTISGSSLVLQPFILPQPISASYLRLFASGSHTSSDIAATSSSTTWTVSQFMTHGFVIYSQGAGASSRSLRYLTSGANNWTWATAVAVSSTAGSLYTLSASGTFGVEGASTNTFTFSYTNPGGVNSYRISNPATVAALFNGMFFMDFPFAASLDASNYWIAFGASSSSTNSGGPAAASNLGFGDSTQVVTQNNSSFVIPGSGTNVTVNLKPGLGRWSTNSILFSTSSIALTDIFSSVSVHALPVFQLIRQA